MNIMQTIRKKALIEEIDYLFLMECLSSYRQPRDKLTKLLKAGEIIRVKKGLYLLGRDYRRRPFSLEILANLIYGPSYVSFEYALSYHHLIPERVARVTSACAKRKKHYATPIGEFIYHTLSPRKFSIGVTWEAIDEYSHFLIATKEKALADTLAQMKPFASHEELREYLVDGMRIDLIDLKELRHSLFQEITDVYQNHNVSLLCTIIKE